MLLHLTLSVSLAAQAPSRAPASPSAARSDLQAVRVWLPDTFPRVGDGARVYVRLASGAHLMVLHADAAGHIRVLFPATPTGSDLVPGGKTFEVAGTGVSGSFPILAPGAGLVLAIRSDRPFDRDGLEASGEWDYSHALLFQPTAGNLFAALLDVADRVTGGRPYQYDQAAYRTPGSGAVRLASGEDVCLECFNAHATAPSDASAPVATAMVVDCSDATLVDSFCGIQDNRSYVTEQAAEAPIDVSGYPVYVPLYVPVFIPGRRHLARPHRPSPSSAIALDPRLRSIPGRVVPPPPRRRPPIIVRQPRAPSHPRSREDDGAPPASRDVRPGSGRPGGRPATDPAFRPPASRPIPATSFVSSSIWATSPYPGAVSRGPRTISPTPAATFALPLTRSTTVPSRAALRTLGSARH
jgi:hypothetical protein